MTLAACEKLGISPSQFTGRPTVTTTFVVDDMTTRTVTASPWTPEDQALMLAWSEYQDGLCDGCGHPKAAAWNESRGSWFERAKDITCWACTAAREPDKDGRREPVTYPVVVDTYDPDWVPPDL